MEKNGPCMCESEEEWEEPQRADLEDADWLMVLVFTSFMSPEPEAAANSVIRRLHSTLVCVCVCLCKCVSVCVFVCERVWTHLADFELSLLLSLLFLCTCDRNTHSQHVNVF